MAEKVVRNLNHIRAKDPRLFEALTDLIQHHQNLTQQVNGNTKGQPLPPPSIDGVTVTGQNGQFHVQIQHRSPIYRGVQYYAEFADNSGFADPHVIHMGDSREHTQFLGNGTYFWRAYAAYASSPPSAPAYHGGATRPQPVSGGGFVGGPALLAPQGSGTGIAGEGLSGPGQVPFRSANGKPPKRGDSSTIPSGGTLGTPLVPGPATGLPEGMASQALASGGGSSTAVSESLIAQAEWLTNVAGTNAITAITAITYQSLAAGFVVRLIPAHTNTGAVTLSVNGITVAAVTKNGSVALSAGELQINRAYLLLWDGTRWQIIGMSLPISATILSSDVNGNPTAAALANTKVWIGSSGNLPVAKSVSGDATLANTGALAVVSTHLTVPLPADQGGTGADNSTQTYTPAITNAVNIDATTAYVCQYSRVGNVVTVSGEVDIDPTAAGVATKILMTLPIASAFASLTQCAGTACDPNNAGAVAALLADVASGEVLMSFISTTAANEAWFFTFTYLVI